MTRKLILGMALLGSLCLATAEADELSLLDAMSTARDQAREVTAARARAEAGAARLKQAKGYRMPQVRFQEIWMTTNSPAEVFALQLNQGVFSFDDFVMSDPNNPDWFENATSRFELMLPIYMGGGLSGRIDQARLAAEADEIKTAWAADSAALAAAEAYIRLAQVRENLILLERSLETVEAHVNLARAYVDQGMLVRSELLMAEVEWARIQDLFQQARGQAKVAEANLSFRLGSDPSTAWELSKLPGPEPIDNGIEPWLTSSETRADLEAARRLLSAAELEVKVQRSALMPKVGLQAKYDFNDQNLFGTGAHSGSVAAVASIDIFSGNRHRAAKAAAEADLEAGRQQLELFEDGIRLGVKDAFETAISSKQRYDTALTAQQAALEAERITEERFKKGVVKMLDLLDASTARQEAETRQLVAAAEAYLATLELAVRSGRQPESVLPNHPTPTSPRTES
ncbi:MAG: TolC family protein [Nitrospirae bacterium]|nr:TolC family protein [Nitrospirota bacterium]